MSEPTTSGGGSTRPAREEEHRERVREITEPVPESTLAAANGPIDYLQQAKMGRAFVDDLGTQSLMAPHGAMPVGGVQRGYLYAAAVDALIDIATTLRRLADLADLDLQPPPAVDDYDEHLAEALRHA